MNDQKRPRKSDLARQRILEAARGIFAAEGYEGATIRSIATEAGVNPALVIRYCGSKEALFATVSALDLKIGKLAGIPIDRFGEALIAHVLGLWEDEQDGSALIAMVRASVSSEAARERIIGQFGGQVGQVFATIAPSARAAAPFIATQIVGLTITRFVWRVPFVAALPRDDVIKTIGATVQRYLDEASASSSSLRDEADR